jgi:hypothetical protein
MADISLTASLRAHHSGLIDWIDRIGGFDNTRDECENCGDPTGPFVAESDHAGAGTCMLCCAEIKGAEDAEREIVVAVLDAVGHGTVLDALGLDRRS